MKKRQGPFTPEQREKILEELESSGLSITEFARQRGLTRVLLSAWRMRSRSRSTPASRVPMLPSPVGSCGVPVALQEIHLGQVLGQSSWAAEIHLPQGITVRLDPQGRDRILEHLCQAGLC